MTPRQAPQFKFTGSRKIQSPILMVASVVVVFADNCLYW